MASVPTKEQQEPLDFVLDNFRVITGEGLCKPEQSDRPGFVIAPNQEDDTASQYRNRQQESDPCGRCIGILYERDWQDAEKFRQFSWKVEA